MCLAGYLDPNVWTFFVPYVELNIGPLIMLAVLGLAILALFRFAISLWSKLLLGAGLVFVVLVAFLIFSGSLCGSPPALLPIEYEHAEPTFPALDYGEATLFVVRPAGAWGPTGIVLWEGKVRIPECEDACTLPEAGVLYRCEEYGFEAFRQEDVSAVLGGGDLVDLLSRTDAPCDLRGIPPRELIEAQVSKRS